MFIAERYKNLNKISRFGTWISGFSW